MAAPGARRGPWRRDPAALPRYPVLMGRTRYDYWPALHALAAALVEHRELSAADVRGIISAAVTPAL